MKKETEWFRLMLAAGLVCAVLAGSFQLTAQTNRYSDRTRAIAETSSRAEKAAEQLVSLSADRIILLLTEEPGLLLEVKKLLARKAYEQGRLLDPDELDDEALFRLVRQDPNVRALITHEIEDRAYVQPKPTREERTRLEAAGVPAPPSALPTPAQPVRQNQEDAYWGKHTIEVPQARSNGAPYRERDESTPLPPAPSIDPRRQVLQAGARPPANGNTDLDQGSLGRGYSRVSPDDLPAVLKASLMDREPGVSPDRDAKPPLGGLTTPPDGNLAEPPADLLPPDPDLPQQASLDTGSRPRAAALPPGNREQDRPNLHHRADPYADVPSLYDLYTQYSKRTPQLQRFGNEVFQNGTGNFDELPMDLPVGPDYVLGPGDSLSIDLWGSVSQRLQRVVDREGRVALPEVGTIEVNGRSLMDVQHSVQSALRSQFRDIQADVSLARLRTVRVYVVGDVQRPGAYDVSSLSTPLNAVYIAGGPSSRGSLRTIRQYRARRLVQQVDVYDLLLHGVHSGMERLQAGDTVLVPPLGPEITIEGMVRRPAIYELGGEKSLSEALELAGGVLPTGTLRSIDIDRLQAHDRRSMLRVDLPELNNQAAVTKILDDFQIQDGDRIRISPILPYSEKTVYLDGHVFKPGTYAYKDGMTIKDVVPSYNDLMPEPYKRHAEIIRLNGPAHEPEILAFNLEDAMSGKGNLGLKPFDTIRVFGRYDFEDPPVITVSGEVRDPGDHITNGATYLRDAVYLAGGATPDAQLDDAQVFRQTEDGKLKVLSVNLSRALAGDQKANLLLEPKDRVFIHKSLAKADPPTVSIQGEVARPGKYLLGTEMTAADLVRLAGGLKRSAYTQEADLTRYLVEHSQAVRGEHLPVPIALALAGEPDTDVHLQDGDVLTIRQLAGWNDVGATITVGGEVAHPGTYGIQENERLSSVIARAGGFRSDAYPYAAVFGRVQVRDLEEKNRAQLIREVRDQGTALKVTDTTNPDDRAAQEAAFLQWRSTLEKLQNTPPAGRLVIHISPEVKRWANTSADISLRAGDSIFIPKKPNFVMVDGAVYNSTAVAYRPGKSAGWYLNQAGGPTAMANRGSIFVIRADGSVVGGSHGMFRGGVLDAGLQPGDVVIVPEKAYAANTRWKNALQVAQLTTSIGIAVQVARSF